MRTYSNNFAPLETETSKEPRFVYQQAWDDADTDHTYFTSGSEAQTPVGADVIASVFQSVTGQTQKINPDIATSTIGSLTVKLVDAAEAVNDKIAAKLALLSGMRGKIGRVYVGYYGIPFSDYDLRVTFVVDSVSYLDGVYSIKLSDLQRSTKKNIFAPHEVTLNASVSATATVIPVTGSDLTLFPTVEHGSEYTTRPGETLSYAKVEDEVFAHTGLFNDATLGPSFAVIERGALNTRAVEHVVDAGKEDSRKPKITEHVFIEGPAPKIIYALYTGVLVGQTGTLPDHWHLGIATAFVKLTDFQSLGVDYWNTTDDTGRFVRIENPGSQSGKRYIEKEMLLWLGAFSPIYADGSIGIKRLTQVLSESSHNVALGVHNVKSYSALTHNMSAVINHIEVLWNWVDAKQDYTKTTALIDATSITIHGDADVKKYAFKAVHTGLHTDEDLLTYLDVLRDRYSGPPLSINVEVLPSLSMLEVGDTVRLTLPQVRDCNTGATLDRTFEVQQVSTNWMTGDIKLSLFGSSMKAGELTRTTLSSVLNDTFYTDKGTELSTVLTIAAGAVTVNGSLTGHATEIDNAAAIYYYDGDLTIDAGVTVSITENVQLRIKGSLQVNGHINGVGDGATGGVATTLFENGTTSYSFSLSTAPIVPRSPPAYNHGEGGYFGTTVSPGNIMSKGLDLSGSPGQPGEIAWLYVPTNANASVGEVSSIPFYQLTNNAASDLLSGYPSDLRGKSGISGQPFIHMTAGWISGIGTDEHLLANGGAGGDGGAGLLVIARGMAYGASGTINLSGGDSAAGTGYTHPVTSDIFHGTSGAPGAPGAFILLLDGNAANPEIDDTNFIASYGDTVTAVGATEIGFSGSEALIYPEAQIGGWPYASSVYNLAPYNATELLSCTSAAHRVIYIPPDETPAFGSQDNSLFPELLANKYTETKMMTETTPPVANQGFGVDAAINNTGERMIVSGQRGAVAPSVIHLIRGSINSFIEQTIAAPDGELYSFGHAVAINNEGDRVFASNHFETVTALASAGAFYIYTRSGTTWALEQRLVAPTPAASDNFGEFAEWNAETDKLIVADGVYLAQKFHYFDRSGTTWTYRSSLAAPGGDFFNTTGNFSMSLSGEWAVIGNDMYNDGSNNVGEIFVYQRSGTAWAHVKTLRPQIGAGYRYGYATAVNYDGSVVCASGNGWSTGVTDSVAVYHRVGVIYTLIQIIDAPSSGDTRFGQRISMSSDGLYLYIVAAIEEVVYVYSRANVSQEFSLLSTHNNADAGSIGLVLKVANSDDGTKMLISSRVADINGSLNTGSVRVWQKQ